jgi:hypothetical protein
MESVVYTFVNYGIVCLLTLSYFCHYVQYLMILWQIIIFFKIVLYGGGGVQK